MCQFANRATKRIATCSSFTDVEFATAILLLMSGTGLEHLCEGMAIRSNEHHKTKEGQSTSCNGDFTGCFESGMHFPLFP